jgi:hypothetical protein
MSEATVESYRTQREACEVRVAFAFSTGETAIITLFAEQKLNTSLPQLRRQQFDTLCKTQCHVDKPCRHAA